MKLQCTYGEIAEILENHLKLIFKQGWSYIKDTKDLFKKVQNMGKISQNSIAVTADVVSLSKHTP